MANDPSAHTAPPPNWGIAVVAAALGCLLLTLGAPRLVAALLSLESRTVVWDVYAEAKVAPATLAGAAADIAAAAAWVRDGEQEGDRGLLLLQQATMTTTAAERTKMREAAEMAAISALAVAPGQPNVWSRLANSRERRGNREGAAAALRMSMLSGSFSPALMAPRIELGLRLLPALDAETRALLKRQIRLTWVIKPDFVAELSNRPVTGSLVREALAELAEFDLAQFQRLHGNGR